MTRAGLSGPLPSIAAMDDDGDYGDPRPDPLGQRCERAKGWAAGFLAALLLGVVIGQDLLIGVTLIGLIFWVGRWIQLARQVHERDAEDDGEDDDGTPPSNIIQFRRDPPP